jgi:hypothetical protein
MAQLPPPDRSQMQGDLEALAQTVSGLIDTRMPRFLRQALAMAGVDPGQRISQACSAPTGLRDDELVTLIEAAAQQLGAWRGVRAPAPRTPELEGALRHLLELVAR